MEAKEKPVWCPRLKFVLSLRVEGASNAKVTDLWQKASDLSDKNVV